MAINKEGTGYTFMFAIIMVVVVGTLLTLTALGLKPEQDANVQQEKMQNILATVKIEKDRPGAAAIFKDIVTERFALDINGKVVETGSGPILATNKKDPFNVDVKKQYRSVKAGATAVEDQRFPLYKCEKNDSTFYVIPMVGSGLWGPIWGYIALNSDLTTVYGASFDHKTETPGLGAEINTSAFEIQFTDERIFDEQGAFQTIKVLKGGGGDATLFGVDGVTGGTITSNGVGEMLERTFKVYLPYIKELKKNS